MRLLYWDKDEVKLTADCSDHEHEYAILSHTWGHDEEEVTFQDLQKGQGREKKGYKKILFCGQQAKEDCLEYFWVDSCCINKSSQSELAEAIISMFRWYRNAAKCYVYLSDVTMAKGGQISADSHKSQWQKDFVMSRWFTRGWTLQELLAPRTVLFYSRDEHHLGDKSSLAKLISSITGIPPAALLATDLSSYDLGQRLSWADNRKTKKPEDRVYCLIGLFNVSLCIRYGEGLDHASLQFIRTLTQDYGMELKGLDGKNSSEDQSSLGSIEIADAPGMEEGLIQIFRRVSKRYSSKTASSHEPNGLIPKDTATQEAKERLLQSLIFPEMNARVNQISVNEPGTFEWTYHIFTRNPESRRWHSLRDWFSNGKGIYWIQGKAGSGKSTLMKFLWSSPKIESLILKNSAFEDLCILKYSFWLSGSSLQRSIIGCFRCLLHQLLEKSDISLQHVFAGFPEMASKQYIGDWSVADLEKAILISIQGLSSEMWIYIFIDGLDELEGRHNYPPFMSFLRKLDCIASVQICVSSRPENFWCNQFVKEPQLRLQDFLEDDIRKYVENRINEAGYQDLCHGQDIKSKVVYSIAKKAEGVFLWVHLAMKSVLYALDGLASWDEIADVIDAMPTEITSLYESMLQRQGKSTAQVRREAALYLKLCLSGVVRYMSDYAIIRLELDRMKGSKPSWSRETLLDTAQKLQIRMPHISAGMIVCHDPKDLLDKRVNDKLHVEVELFHRTVKDFLTDMPAGQALLKDCEISDDSLVRVLIDGHLNYARATHPTYILLYLKKGMSTLCRLRKRGFNFSDEVMTEAIKNLDGEFLSVPKPDKSLAPYIIDDTGLSQHQLLSTAPSEPCPTDLLPLSRLEGDVTCCLDIIGLSLFAHLSEYANHILRANSTAAFPGRITLAASYKNYLLLCTLAGGFGTSNVGYVLSLIDAGADPFADIYLPTWQPIRHCAAEHIVAHFRPHLTLGALFGYLLTDIEQVLFKRIIAVQSNKTMILCLTHENYTRNLRSVIKLNDYEETDRSWKSQTPRKCLALFQTPVIAQLRQFLALHERKSVNWDPLNQGEINKMWLVSPRAHQESFWNIQRASHTLPAVIELTKDETQDVIRASKLAKEQDEDYSKRDIFDIPSIRALTPSLPLADDLVDQRRWVDAKTFLFGIDYLVDKSDPRVPKSPFIRLVPAKSERENDTEFAEGK